MAGTFILGETKVRPGTYFNIQKKGGNAAAGVMNGVTAVIFRADFGPLNEAIELSAEDGYEGIFGTALTTDAMKEAIAGGAKTIIACRVGNGGTQGSIKLQDSESTDAVSITAKYPGAKDFVVTVREKLSDSTLKECIFYAGTTEFEKVEFAAGTDEANALVGALASSNRTSAEESVFRTICWRTTTPISEDWKEESRACRKRSPREHRRARISFSRSRRMWRL